MKLIDLFEKFLPSAEIVHDPKPRRRRGFDMADTGRLFSTWGTSSQSPDQELRGPLTILRARSRDLTVNNDYARKFLVLLDKHVVGPFGVRVQWRVKDPGGTPDKVANDMIEAAWKEWAKKGNCTVSRDLTLTATLRLVVRSVARDGEVLIRKVRGFKNPHGFALQLIEADHLDETRNETLANGNRIRMGVEFDSWGARVAYHIRTTHPGEGLFTASGGGTERIPADEIIHFFLADRIGQARGFPWFVSSSRRLRMLGGYEEAELVAARTAAAKMGFFKHKTGDEFVGDELDEDLNFSMSAEPGSMESLPPGLDFTPWDPQHPTAAFGAFVKDVLRGAAAGLMGVGYNLLTGDLEGVNYSSLRQGALEDRDLWTMLQEWLIDHVLDEIRAEWLKMALLTGAVPLPPSKISKFNSVRYQPKRWAWVDPYKEEKANEIGLANKTTSRTKIMSDNGDDRDEIFDDLKIEAEILKDIPDATSTPAEPGMLVE